MSLLAIVVALALEQWRAFEWRTTVERSYVAYVRGIEQRLNGGTLGQGMLATALAVVPPVAVAAFVWWRHVRDVASGADEPTGEPTDGPTDEPTDEDDPGGRAESRPAVPSGP